MNSFWQIFGYSDVVIRGKHAQMMEEMKNALSLRYVDIFISALQLGLMDNKFANRDSSVNTVVKIARPSLLMRENKLNAIVDASLIFRCEGGDINQKAINYMKIFDSNKETDLYKESIMSAVLGGIEEFYEIISNDIECDMKIN